MTEKEYEDWVYKCLQCKHSYTKKDDAETAERLPSLTCVGATWP